MKNLLATIMLLIALAYTLYTQNFDFNISLIAVINCDRIKNN